MSDSPTSTTAASAAPASPAASPTLGAAVDAEITLIRARIAALEATGKTDWADVVAWVKTNWPHFVSWASGAVIAAKVGVFADIAKLI